MGKVWKSIKGVVKKAAPVVGAIAGNAILPGIGGAMAGAFLGSVAAGNNTRQHLFSAGAAGVGAAAGSAVGSAGGEVAKQGVNQAVSQTGSQVGGQTLAQSGSQTLSQVGTQEATKKTFSEVAKQTLTKYGTQIKIASATAAGTSAGTKVKAPSIDNSAEVELMKREAEYNKRKRSSLFETKGGAAGERVGYTGSENRGSIFGN
jgi:hypothetical protein